MPQPGVIPDKLTLFQRIRYSIFPGTLRPIKDRADYRRFFNSLILHFRPRTVPERTLRFTLTWGLGGMAVVLIFLLFGTGILMKFIYQPFPDKAYESILHLQRNVLFGQFVRNIHHWSGNILLIIVFLHFLRVFFTGAFHPPRQFNWVIGFCLFLTVLMSNFTGYLLPWDQLSFWAITICTGMLEYIPGVGLWLQRLIRGGSEVGTATLSNFYAIHTAILPALLITLMPFHFWRVRKAAGLVIPRSPEEDPEIPGEGAPGIPNLILKEVVTALVLIAFILIISAFFEAPLESKANSGLSPNPTKAPWYFMGFQEILLHLHPFMALFLIPVLMIMALVSIPYVQYPSSTEGVWFASVAGRRSARDAALVALVATPFGILLDEYLTDFAAWMPDLSPAISNGLVPFFIILSVSFGTYLLLKRRHSANKNESVQMIFVFFLIAFIILTITGIWFRGSGMRLVWPWGI
jgi:quinol-cytochrome oxidoreductase complex cytochrome b subunit